MEEGSPLGGRIGELRLTSISPHHDIDDQDEPCNTLPSVSWHRS